MDNVAKELTSVSLATTMSVGLRSAAYLQDKLDVETTSRAKKTSEDVLVSMMQEDGLISLDPDLALRAFEVISTHEINLIEAKRKFLETQVEIFRVLKTLEGNAMNDVLSEGASDIPPDPQEDMENTLFSTGENQI